MELDDLFLDLMFLNICRLYKKCNPRRQIRRWGIRPINKDHACGGYYQRVFLGMKVRHSEQLFAHTRMTGPVFDSLLKLVRAELQKNRQRIYAEERLSLTLLHLAQGESFQSIANSYKLGKTTVRNIVLETCEALWRILSPIYVREPTVNQYKEIVKDFNHLWDIPNCVGAVDGKHITVKYPTVLGAKCHNVKSQASVVLMAACDAKYRFTTISIGGNGNQSDGGIFKLSAFCRALLSNKLLLPTSAPLSNASANPFPHFFVGNTAFPLMNNLMRPYSSLNLNQTTSIFNGRLSRVHRVIENSFGILTARWRILTHSIECSPENCETIVLACIALHNFCMTNDREHTYCPAEFVDRVETNNSVRNGAWRNDLVNRGGPLRSITSSMRRGPVSALGLRDNLAQYFINEGAINVQHTIDENT